MRKKCKITRNLGPCTEELNVEICERKNKMKVVSGFLRYPNGFIYRLTRRDLLKISDEINNKLRRKRQ